MYKITNIRVPKYITDFIPKRKISYNIRNGNKPFFFNCRTQSFKNWFFLYTIEAWYSLDLTSSKVLNEV